MGAEMSRYRTRSGLHYSQPNFRDDMDLWGETKGEEIWQEDRRKSAVLGPDGNPLEYIKPRLGFDLTPRGRK